MNKTINKFLLAGDKFIHNIHLRQPVFTYSTCEPFTGNKDRIQKLKKQQEIDDVIIKMN